MVDTPTPLGIIAGGGELPIEVARAVQSAGRDVFIAGIEGFAEPAIREFAHGTFHLGTLNAPLSMLKSAGCGDLVIAGRAERPNISALRLDGKALRSLPRILSILVGGDDTVLTGLVRFIEEHGFRVVGVPDVAPDLVMGVETIGGKRGARRFAKDIALGFDALETMGPLDIGQSVVVVNQRIVAVEAAEGTDAMVARVAALRQEGRIRAKAGTGVLVKAPKPDQDLRVDMPTIGPDTVAHAEAAGLAGIAVEAGGVLIADRAGTSRHALESGVFVVGMAP